MRRKVPKLVPIYRRWGGDAAAMAYRVWRVRTALKLTKKDMAKVYGVTRGTVSNWESGKNCPNGSAIAILKDLEAGGEPTSLRSLLADREVELARKRLRIAQKYVYN